MFLEALGHAVIDNGGTVAWFNVEQLGAIVRAHPASTTARAFPSAHNESSTLISALDGSKY